MTRWISLLLTAVLLLSMCVGTVTATAETTFTNGDPDFEYVLNRDGTATITKYIGYALNVVIPENIEGHTVTSIQQKAFTGADIRSVTFPDTLETVGESAFSACYYLDNISLPESVHTIGTSAFSQTKMYKNEANWQDGVFYIDDCLIDTNDDLPTECVVKDGTRVIAEEAFYYQENVQSIILSDTVVHINDHAFSGCLSLLRLTLPDNVVGFTTGMILNTPIATDENRFQDGFWYIDNHLIAVKGDVGSVLEIREGTKTICNEAFSSHYFPNNETLEAVIFPDSLRYIGKNAFARCLKLTSVEMNEGLVTIGDRAFWESGVKTVSLPSTVRYVGDSAFERVTVESFGEQLEVIGDSAFAYCSNESIVLPKSVKRIGEGAFGLSTASSVVLSDELTYIGAYAFKMCENLTAITVPDNVKIIDDEAFADCTALADFTLSDSVVRIGEKAFYNTAITELSLPKGLETLGANAIASCESLTSVSVGGPTFFEHYQFENCPALKRLDVADIRVLFETIPGMRLSTRLDCELYMNGEPATDIVVPDGVTSIPDGAFEFANIKTVSIPASVKMTPMSPQIFGRGLEKLYVADWVSFLQGHYGIIRMDVIPKYELFVDGTAPTTAYVPYGFTGVSGRGYEAVNFTQVIIPATVDTIGYLGFGYSQTVTKIYMPRSVTTFENWSFTLPNLKEIYYAGSEEEWKRISKTESSGLSENVTVHFNATYMSDLTGDGVIDTSEARCILRHVVMAPAFNENVEKTADYDGNGVVNTSDVRALLLDVVNTVS